MAKCANCGSELQENANFCTECGERVASKNLCPQCGAELPSEAKFCLECGAKISTDDKIKSDGGSKEMNISDAADAKVSPELLEIFDKSVNEKDSFLMPIEDIFTISGRGTVVVGQVERGTINMNDIVEIVGIRPTQTSIVTGIEMFNKLLDSAIAGDNVGIFLRGIDKKSIERGQVLAKPGTIFPYSKFKAQIDVLPTSAGGRKTPFFSGYRPQFYFRTADISGTVILEEGTDMAKPGETVRITGELIHPIALEEGTNFAIYEGSRTIAYGKITKIIE